MNKWIFFGIGAAVGSAVTLLSVRNHYRKLAFHEIHEARETLHDVYRKKLAAKELADKNSEQKERLRAEFDGKSDKTEDISESVASKTSQNEAISDKKDAFNEALNRYSGRFNVFKNPPDESKIDNGYSDESDSEEDFGGSEGDPYELTVDHEAPSEGNSELPFMISEDEFASEKLFYDKVMIEYYDDGVAVLEDTDEIVDRLEDLIGPYILSHPREEDTIYVRNENRSTDYGIIFKGTTFVPEEGSP